MHPHGSLLPIGRIEFTTKPFEFTIVCFDHRPPLITSTWTAYEALTIVKTKLGYNQAETLWQRMLHPSVVTLIKVDERIEAGALELFWSYRDKDWGVVDCASLRVMEETGCQQAFAFDRHFTEASKQYGFSLARK